jgi:hypothetical protein
VEYNCDCSHRYEWSFDTCILLRLSLQICRVGKCQPKNACYMEDITDPADEPYRHHDSCCKGAVFFSAWRDELRWLYFRPSCSLPVCLNHCQSIAAHVCPAQSREVAPPLMSRHANKSRQTQCHRQNQHITISTNAVSRPISKMYVRVRPA